MNTAYCFDLDGTVTTTEILPCIASELDVTDEIATLTRLTMDGHIPFADSMRLRCLILGQVGAERVNEVVRSVPLDPQIVDFIHSNADRCFIITGNLDVWLQPLMQELPCYWFCSKGTIAEGRLKLDYIIDKGATLSALHTTHNFDRYVAVGDGANDQNMLAAADVGIAYGGVHAAALATINEAQFIVNSSGTLCNLLKGL
ncbi:MAG: HAD family phosphatase [Acidihalobacter sp.]|uniref:HAD family phosphatase n=1 Tax=Acidihalobacter sp. TaxID=1872108 RepID=UPI00307FB1F3